VSTHDPNSELTPPGSPLPEDETPDETRFDSESPAPRPPGTSQESPGQTIEPIADEAHFAWRAPEPVQFSQDLPTESGQPAVTSDAIASPAESPATFPAAAAEAGATSVSPSEPAAWVEAPTQELGTRPVSAREREFAERIRDLTAQIEHYPNTPVNFVFRGEVYLAQRQPEAAVVDFQRALDLAESRVDELPWGYVNAGLIDRAREGLAEAQERLQASRA